MGKYFHPYKSLKKIKMQGELRTAVPNSNVHTNDNTTQQSQFSV